MLDKTNLRQQLRQTRQAIKPQLQQQAAKQLADHFIQTAPLTETSTIACYLSQDHEIDTQPLITQLRAAGHRCYLPIINQDKTQRLLQFGRYETNTPLINNRFAIPEPETTDIITADQCDIVLAPLVAYDQQGHRLGMGGGYYDTTLAQCETKPTFIGMAYAQQQVAHIPTETHDIDLDAIATEQGLVFFNPLKASTQ